MSNPLKRATKRGLQHLAARFGPHTHLPSEPQLLVLMYHRILPEEDSRTRLEEPGMVVTPDTFRSNLESISRFFEFVSLSSWIERRAEGLSLPRKACAVTFDDGWQDNYEFAYPILQELGIPATIFLVSDMIGTDELFWPERLSRIVIEISRSHSDSWRHPSLKWLREAHTSYQFKEVAPTREELSQLINASKDLPDQEIHARLDGIQDQLGINNQAGNPSLLNWNQVADMSQSGLIEVGSHTRHHIRLNSRTPRDIMESEIVSSKKHIENLTHSDVKTFCFPNGDYSEEALDLVQQNYIGAVTTSSGWNSAKTDNYLLQRIGIHQDVAGDEIAFLARISGWF
jgi:peptidoglycan/xylan/chitin deacetylase (PgdA/CDA1 family)